MDSDGCLHRCMLIQMCMHVCVYIFQEREGAQDGYAMLYRAIIMCMEMGMIPYASISRYGISSSTNCLNSFFAAKPPGPGNGVLTLKE